MESDIEEELRHLESFDSIKNDNYYDPKYRERWKEKDDFKANYARSMALHLIIEAKQDPKRPRRTLLTVDHFREIQRFSEWLDDLEYPFEMPGIPKGTLNIEGLPTYKSNNTKVVLQQRLAYLEKPKAVTWYDMCKKEDIIETVWPAGTPEECRYNPNFCPGLKTKTKYRCEKKNYPLDFIYETKFRGYNFKKFRNDDDIV